MNFHLFLIFVVISKFLICVNGGCCPLLSPPTCPAVNPLTARLSLPPKTCAVDHTLVTNKLLACKQNLLLKKNALLLKSKELCWSLKQKLLKKIADILTMINYKKINKCNKCCCYDSETHYKDVDHGGSCKKTPFSSRHTHPVLDMFDNILERRADAWTNIRDKLATNLPMGI